MKKNSIVFIVFIFSMITYSQSEKVAVTPSKNGFYLKVNNENFMVKGMNWDYYPIGKNYDYVLWHQSEDFIQKALNHEMGLLKNMGVNTIRVYTGIPKKWIEYIYTNFGIYTMLNHSFGRYGVAIDGNWTSNTDYADPKVRETLLNEVQQLVSEYKNTKGLLLYLLGNENNFGLFWQGAETEDIPVVDKKSTKLAKAMYQLFNEAALAMKSNDMNHPVAICNGDLLFLNELAKACPAVDILGINVYRGVSFGDLYERVNNEYGKPVLLTEFGSDAFNATTQKEDQKAQAAILKGNWNEIYENAAGLGKSQNSIGGFTFQFSDGWWKMGQTINLDIHDSTASWANGGYLFDFEKGKNNMNEEWFGICAKGKASDDAVYPLYPRLAYYLLKEVHQIDPYRKRNSVAKLQKKFEAMVLENIKMK
ncbi:glycosyl hydrolase [Flavobacterium sp. TSSA_36]|uniref:glycosyl hydrolase n=1 Tax=Flavobacterium sp. TSSA_36 TaxID=3447669 RepID=UPI003F324DBC